MSTTEAPGFLESVPAAFRAEAAYPLTFTIMREALGEARANRSAASAAYRADRMVCHSFYKPISRVFTVSGPGEG